MSSRPTIDWPPPHAVRVSARARRVSLRMHPDRGLEVVTPRPLSAQRVSRLLDQHRDWIEHHLPKTRIWSAHQLPSSINLPALGQRWTLEHCTEHDQPRLKACPATMRLTLHGEIAALWPLLGRWLGQHAKSHFLPQISELARRHGFALKGASVRWSRTRWGSCSRRGTISLSARLLWLTPDEVHYVMLHELTHLAHFHHGPTFWQALEECCAGARQIDMGLRRASRELPAWLPLLQEKS